MQRLRSVSPIPVGCYCCQSENGSESDKLLVIERDSERHEDVVSDSEVHKPYEVSEVRLAGEPDHEPKEVSKVDYEEVSEVGMQPYTYTEVGNLTSSLRWQSSSVVLVEDCEVFQADEWYNDDGLDKISKVRESVLQRE